MHSKWNLWLLAGLVVSLGACSSSQQSLDGDAAPEEVPAAEAGTDAVPSTAAEAPAPSTEEVKLPDEAPAAPSEAKAPDALPAVDAVPADSKPADAAVPAPMADATKPADVSPASTSSETSSVASASSGETQEYTIQKGDTLMQIAYETYGDLYQWKKIYEQNKDKLPNASTLVAGTVLKLEKPSSPVSIEKNGDRYMIKSGDTLGTISDDVYGTKKKWRKLWENNKTLIKNPNRIFAGFYLYYTMTPEEKQKADELKGKKELTPAPMAQQDVPAQAAPAAAAPFAPVAQPGDTAAAPQPQSAAPQVAAPGPGDERAPAAVTQ